MKDFRSLNKERMTQQEKMFCSLKFSSPHTRTHTHIHTQLVDHVRKTKSELMFI